MRTYLRLDRLDDVLEMLWAEGPQVRLLAGGTDLLVHGALQDAIVLDISRIDELRGMHQADERWLRIGACTTHAEIGSSRLISRLAHLLGQACRSVGSMQIRNLGTIGGNLANASPAADSVPALACLGAEVELASTNGRRRLPVLDFTTGPGQTVLRPDELVEAVWIPPQAGRRVGFFAKTGQRRGVCCSKVSVAFWARRMGDGSLWDVRIALGAVAPTVMRAREAENLLEGRRLVPGLIQQAAEACSAATSPISDIRSTADYRRKAAGAMLARGLFALHDDIESWLKRKKRRRRR